MRVEGDTERRRNKETQRDVPIFKILFYKLFTPRLNISVLPQGIYASTTSYYTNVCRCMM